MKIKTAIQAISEQLTQSDSARLDAELLISLVTQQTRSQLYANTDNVLSTTELQQLNTLIKRRLTGEPMAYILGTQEFWSLLLTVNQHVLIPRPETEHLVEWLLQQLPASPQCIADLGTGSGAIAIALVHERPHWQVDATDKSEAALTVANKNIAYHQLTNICCHLGNWCEPLPQQNYDAIITNPPYLAANDLHLTSLQFEPYKTALIAGDDGLADIANIIHTAENYLAPRGYLVIEHGYQQAKQVVQLCQQHSYINIQSHQDYAGHARFVTAQREEKQ